MRMHAMPGVPALLCAGVSEDDVLNAVRVNMTCESDRLRYYAQLQPT